MGSSYVEFQGRGFWSWDGYLEHFLANLAEAASGMENMPEWLVDARDHWAQQSSGIFGGWISPRFNDYLTTDSRRDQVLQLVNSVSAAHNATPELAQTCSFVSALLRGELNTDAASPLDYMVSGPHPYNWPPHKTKCPQG